MNKYIITTESTVDLSKEHLENINVKYIEYQYNEINAFYATYDLRVRFHIKTDNI